MGEAARGGSVPLVTLAVTESRGFYASEPPNPLGYF
jgi:hypothetical protein